jgi:hypothetical protein
MAITATAQNAAPSDKPAGTNTMQTAPQSGTQAAPNSNAPANNGYGGTTGTMGTMNSPATSKYKALSDTDVRAYTEGRTACDRTAPGAAQDACRSQFNSKWASVDPKCQKVAVGSELDQCLKGSDRAN